MGRDTTQEQIGFYTMKRYNLTYAFSFSTQNTACAQRPSERY